MLPLLKLKNFALPSMGYYSYSVQFRTSYVWVKGTPVYGTRSYVDIMLEDWAFVRRLYAQRCRAFCQIAAIALVLTAAVTTVHARRGFDSRHALFLSLAAVSISSMST